MHFLNPALLLGLVTAVIPLAIHLLNRGRTPPRPFSNLAFLRRLHQSRMRRMRMRQWLALFLRTLAILLIVCAFARPAYQSGNDAWLGSSIPTAAVVLLDQSYSTRYNLPGGRIFDQLQHQALALLDLFDPRDQIVFIPFAGKTTPLEDIVDLQHLKERVRGLVPGEGSTNIAAALQAAEQQLAGREGMNREVFLFTDLAAYNWSEVEDRGQWLPEVPIYVIAPEEEARDNLHVDAVRVLTWMPAPGKKLAVKVSLINGAKRPAAAVALDLYVADERVRHREVNLDSGEEAEVEFIITPPREGRLTAHVEAEDDDLALDNRRYFALEIPSVIRVLLLGGQPSDTYYPRQALNSVAVVDPVLEIESALFADLDEESLEEVHVLLMCNLVRLDADQTRLLHNFVAAGGGLVVFPSTQADLNFFNRDLLPGLLPVNFKGIAGDSEDVTSFQLIDRDRSHHSVFQDLLTDVAQDQPRFYASFELAPTSSLQSLAYFEDGHLALVQGWKELGRTVLFAAPLSLQWNDLPLKGIFVPLLHRLVRHLGLPPDHRNSYMVGQPVLRRLDGIPFESAVQAETPSGRRIFIEPELVQGRYYWKIPQADESGLWRLSAEGRPVDRFPVNVDTRESVLTPLGRPRLNEIFGPHRTQLIHTREELAARVLGNRYGRELWREFLALALAVLMLELWIARAPRGMPATQNPAPA